MNVIGLSFLHLLACGQSEQPLLQWGDTTAPWEWVEGDGTGAPPGVLTLDVGTLMVGGSGHLLVTYADPGELVHVVAGFEVGGELYPDVTPGMCIDLGADWLGCLGCLAQKM